MLVAGMIENIVFQCVNGHVSHAYYLQGMLYTLFLSHTTASRVGKILPSSSCYYIRKRRFREVNHSLFGYS